jgi:hypothetical protein
VFKNYERKQSFGLVGIAAATTAASKAVSFDP